MFMWFLSVSIKVGLRAGNWPRKMCFCFGIIATGNVDSVGIEDELSRMTSHTHTHTHTHTLPSSQ